ncbi:hypothetical protein F5887DRAFT_1078852 [Amanita rubescens]|nr:hypothetical protein F5887DRAFT_1078852 [Amanita rubescens]
MLHNLTRKKHTGAPVYEDKWNGREWKSTVKIGGTTEGEGAGNDKDAAQDNAAKVALQGRGVAV